MDKKVSIIIPIYNVAEFIDECIESAHKQTYRNIEIILVDDGSPDDSGKRCDAWAKRDDRIKVIHKINGGLSSARNAGLDVATGEYIYFLDGDDFIKEDLLENVISQMEQGFDMVSFSYEALYEDGNIQPVLYNKYGSFEFQDERAKCEFLIQFVANGRIGWEAWTRVFKRDIIEQNRLRFADNRKIFAEDLYFSLCYCFHANNVKCIEKAFYYYRKRESSIMGQENTRLNVNRINELGKEVLQYYVQHSASEYILNNFPAIHFVVVNNIIFEYQKVKQLPLKELRKQIIDDIEDFQFFKNQFENIKKFKDLIRPAYSSRIRYEEKHSVIKYILDGDYVAIAVRNKINSTISKIRNMIR